MKSNILKTGLLGGAAAILGIAGAGAHKTGEESKTAPDDGQVKVQLAILLDTSGSMSGLIEQTKTQLWSIVNTFIDARQNGKVPFVEVALFEYGNDGLTAENHWIRRIQPLSRDLDQISADLFALRTNGGSEYCGAVVKRAAEDLDWDPSPGVYKAIFVAGNEAFTQGPVEPTKACRSAIAKGVIVNTIHCGDEATGISGGWKSGAMLADGKFMVIDHNKAIVHIDAPQDAEILKLNEDLNKTYVPLGTLGKERIEQQAVQDANAVRSKGNAAASRVNTKASSNYWNGNWDLVDASKVESFDWAKLKEEDLPEDMKKLTVGERKDYVARKQEERTALQKQIRDLNEERRKFVDAKRREQGESGDTLDEVMVGTVREQAVTKGYEFDGK